MAFGQNQRLDSLFKVSSEKLQSGDITAATALLLDVQKQAEKANYTALLCRIQVNLGKTGLITENNAAAEEAINKGEILCGVCKDTLNLAKLLLQKGVLFLKFKQMDAATQAFKQSAVYYLIAKDTVGESRALAKLGNTVELQGKYAEAQAYYQKFYENARKKPESVDFLNANIYLTGNYLYLHDPQKALFHNSLVLAAAKKLNANYEYSEALRNDAMIYKQLGEKDLAFEKLNHFATYYQDTLMSKVQLDQTEEMKAKYEAEKKEAQIALQETQLEKQNFRFWVVISGLVLSLLAGALLFRLTRQLRKRNEEKEFLIKEIHHRVKNNLQILSSLLHLQSRQITDDTALHAVREGQNRVDTMGLIHQKLYMGDNVAKVEMKDYLEQFGQNILDSFGIEDERVQVEYALEPMYLDVDTAIPLGLIINELTTNSLKYAFPGDRSGVIKIALRKNEQNHLVLSVSDNGVGLAAITGPKTSSSFGTSLVQMLSKKLKGKPEITQSETGYATTIVFEKYN